MDSKTAKKLQDITNQLYEKEAESFSDTRKEIWEKEIAKFVEQIKPGNLILDLGCGNGRLVESLRFKVIGFKYLGIDSSKKLIKMNQDKYQITTSRSSGTRNDINCSVSQRESQRVSVYFEVGDGLNLKYKDKFDYIICNAVLHHIPSEELQIKFLKNIYSALKPGGKILISVWNRLQKKYWKYLISNKIKGMGIFDTLVPWKKSGEFRYIHIFRAEELKRLTQKAGLKNIKCYISRVNGKGTIFSGLQIYLEAEK